MPSFRVPLPNLTLMRFTHVFATHSLLQVYLVEAIIRQENIDPERVLVLRVRDSYRPEETADYTILDGGKYSNQNGRNLLKHRRINQRRYLSFKADVLDRLAPGFQMYSPMFTYWYLHVLASRAGAYHVLEDGLGSYQSLEELSQYFDLLTPQNWRQHLSSLQRRMLMVPGQNESPGRSIKLLDGVGKCYGTLEGCFPWKAPEERVLVENVFPAKYVGEFSGAWLMGTSCLVEAGRTSLSVYLEILRTVLAKIADRGVKTLVLKLHPTQASHPVNAAAYRAVFAEFADRLEVRELPQHYSLECLAAGNELTFVTGISTLGFHVASTGCVVYNYLDVIESQVPGFAESVTKTGLEIFQRITRPL